jgi:hypothetical protein
MNNLKTIAAVALLLGGSASFAQADQLPNLFIATWCHADYGNPEVPNERMYEACDQVKSDSDDYLIIKQNTFKGHETDCRYLSVKRTGKVTSPWTHALKSEMVPVMKVVLRCNIEGEKETTKLEIAYSKATLYVKRLPSS